MDFFNRLVERFLRFRGKMQRWYRLYLSLAMVVVFVTTYILILPALTMDVETAEEEPGISMEDSSEEGKASKTGGNGSKAESANDGDAGKADAESVTEGNISAITEHSSGAEGKQESSAGTALAGGSAPSGNEADKKAAAAEDKQKKAKEEPAKTDAPTTPGTPAVSGVTDGNENKDSDPASEKNDASIKSEEETKNSNNDNALAQGDASAKVEGETKNSNNDSASPQGDASAKAEGETKTSDNDNSSSAEDGKSEAGGGDQASSPEADKSDNAAAQREDQSGDSGTEKSVSQEKNDGSDSEEEGASAEEDQKEKEKSSTGKDKEKDKGDKKKSSSSEPDRTNWPALILDEALETIRVRVEAPAGAFPEGTTMRLERVKASEVLEAVDQAAAQALPGKNVSLGAAIDIHFMDADKKEIQPWEDIKVVFISLDEDNKISEETAVIHIDEKGKGTLVESKMEKLPPETVE